MGAYNSLNKEKETIIKSDFPLSKLPEPALALVMHHLPLNGILFFIFTIFLRSILYWEEYLLYYYEKFFSSFICDRHATAVSKGNI